MTIKQLNLAREMGVQLQYSCWRSKGCKKIEKSWKNTIFIEHPVEELNCVRNDQKKPDCAVEYNSCKIKCILLNANTSICEVKYYNHILFCVLRILVLRSLCIVIDIIKQKKMLLPFCHFIHKFLTTNKIL